MSKFFIHHPVFAWVIAILISLSGFLAISRMGVESYPNIVPPQISISTGYPGADAKTMEQAVTQIIEQQLSGIDGLLFFNSSSASGRTSITLTFKPGTNPDIAQVQVQNKVALATPLLPSEVIQQGVVVSKNSAGFLMVVGLRSENPAFDRNAMADLLSSQVLDQITRLPGVGSANLFGGPYAMNIWLNPEKLQAYGMSPAEVLNAVRAQNVQFAAGNIGTAPAMPSQQIQASIVAEGRFTHADEFRNIMLRTQADGTVVRLSDVARVERGPSSSSVNTQWTGTPTAGFGVQLAPGANALTVTDAIKQRMAELQPSFPAGVTWFTPYDSSTFVNLSIKEVLKTLLEAMVLVFLVMLLFLQNIRATIIPTLVIPVALLGTFLLLQFFGFSINQLTLFGIVLAIGIVVDDAIVVIENVERIMREEGLSAIKATEKAMGQISGAVIAITVVLAAVFVPSAFQPGSAGAVFRQFAITIAVAMGFSAFLALGFTPALCATMLKPHNEQKTNRFFAWFNRQLDRFTNRYVRWVGGAIRRVPIWMMAFVVLAVLAGFLFQRMPNSFLPEEDQGFALAFVQLPAGASLERTQTVFDDMRPRLQAIEGFDGMMEVSGFSFIGSGENVGIGFIRLKHWNDREQDVQAFLQQANQAVFGIRDARIFVVNLPTVMGLGAFGGFSVSLQDRAGVGRDTLKQAQGMLLGAAAQNPVMTGVRPNTLPEQPKLKLTVDRLKASTMGLSVAEIYQSIQLMLARVYVNDFMDQGRIKRVLMQADAPYRMDANSIDRIHLPSKNGSGAMVPLSTVVNQEWMVEAPALSRYNGYPATSIVGNAAPGRSSGEAMDAIKNIITTQLPEGVGYEWSGQSFQEQLSGNIEVILFGLSLLVVFFCLAALYESWSVPIAVLMIVPLGLLGAVLFTQMRGLPNDIFFKIGLITVIGLAAKNAILIIEFAIEAKHQGKSLRDSILEAAKLRLRPILMTSFTFIMGVVPMAISTGAGANARHAIGTGVIGGMLFATVLGVLLIPVFYVFIRQLLGDRLDEAHLSK